MGGKIKFFYNGMLLSLVGLLMRGVQLFLGAYVSRAVGAEGVGLNTLVMTAFSFALTLATSGVGLTVTRLTATAVGGGTPGEDRRILKGAVVYALIFSSLATAVLLLLSGVIGSRLLGDGRATLSLQILAFSLIPSAMTSVISGYFVGLRRVSLNAVWQVLGQALKIGITVLLLSLFSASGVEYAVAALALGITLTELICFLVALLQLLLFIRKRRRGSGGALSEVSKMALPLALSAYIRSALLTLEHSLIPKRLTDRGESGAEALSSYGYLHGMALPLILYPLTPLSSFSGLLVPEFAESLAEGKKTRLSRLSARSLSATLGYGIAVAVFIGFFAEELGFAVYGSYEAGRYIAMLAPVVPIMYLDHVTDSILKGIGEHIYSMWVNIADATLSVVLVWVLIPLMGISGYAVVIIGMEAFNFALSYLRLKKRLSFRLSLADGVVIPLISSVLAVFVADRLFINAGSSTTLTLLILKGAFSLAVFVFVLTVIKGARRRKKIEN